MTLYLGLSRLLGPFFMTRDGPNPKIAGAARHSRAARRKMGDPVKDLHTPWKRTHPLKRLRRPN
jgi:hypothetical protein